MYFVIYGAAEEEIWMLGPETYSEMEKGKKLRWPSIDNDRIAESTRDLFFFLVLSFLVSCTLPFLGRPSPGLVIGCTYL